MFGAFIPVLELLKIKNNAPENGKTTLLETKNA